MQGSQVGEQTRPAGLMPAKRKVETWASTYSMVPQAHYSPTTLEEVQEIVRLVADRGGKLRVVGSAHSPNPCAMCPDVMLSLDSFQRVLAVDVEACTVKVQAGIRLWQLHEVLDFHGLAMQNLGSISDQSIAGALATGTHGTGAGFGIIASTVIELQMVLATGELVTASHAHNADVFKAALCSMGVLGVVTCVTLKVVPAFHLASQESPSTLSQTLGHLEDDLRGHDWYRFWWFPHTNATWEWRAKSLPPQRDTGAAASAQGGLASRVLPMAWVASWYAWVGGWVHWCLFTLFGFHILQAALFLTWFVPSLTPLINALWQAVLFSWPRKSIDRSDRAFNFNCLFKQHVDEWAIPTSAVAEALHRLERIIKEKHYQAHFPVEVRFVRGDDIWCSPAFGRDTAYIGVIMYKPYGVELPYRAFFDDFERIMASLGGRPHWAKDFRFTAADFAAAYPKWDDFRSLAFMLDPKGVFSNEWADRVVRGFNADGSAVKPWLEEAELRALAQAVRKHNGTGTGLGSGAASGLAADMQAVSPPALSAPVSLRARRRPSPCIVADSEE